MDEKKQIGQMNFEAYGVKLAVKTNERKRFGQIEICVAESLPNGFALLEENETEHLIESRHEENGRFQIFKDGENVATGAGDEVFYKYLNSQIRLTIAEHAVGCVFLHAGVVGWNGKAVVIPAKSFSGKTTLVAELLKRGATYYSDEYAVLDQDARVHPFAKPLSMRGIVDDETQIEMPPILFGAKIGEQPLPVGLVLICEFVKNLESPVDNFEPEILSAGQGMLEMLAHAIPARRDPKFALEILKKVATRAIIAKCQRWEARSFAEFLIDFLSRAS